MRSLLILLLGGLAATGAVGGCQTLSGAFDKSTANARAGIVRAKKFTESNDSKGTMYWSHFDATKRSSVINARQDGSILVLAEVTPDAAVQKSLDALAKANVADKVDAELQLKTASTIAQLGQRTANVNMLRDALYRLAEGANNNPGVFYFFGSPTPAPSAAPAPAPATTPRLGNANVRPDASPASGAQRDAPTCPTCGTTYERLFMATLKTYEAAVQAEAQATKAQAEADKAKAELEKAKLEAKGSKPDTTAAQKLSKPTSSIDSTGGKVKKTLNQTQTTKIKQPKAKSKPVIKP